MSTRVLTNVRAQVCDYTRVCPNRAVYNNVKPTPSILLLQGLVNNENIPHASNNDCLFLDMCCSIRVFLTIAEEFHEKISEAVN